MVGTSRHEFGTADVFLVGAQLGHGHLTEVPSWGCHPLALLLDRNSPSQADHAVSIGEEADNIRATTDLSVQPFQRIGGVQLPLVLARKGHVGQDALFSVF